VMVSRSGQGANHSDSLAIARICNAAMGAKTRFQMQVICGTEH
jgi:hypothetical protein